MIKLTTNETCSQCKRFSKGSWDYFRLVFQKIENKSHMVKAFGGWTLSFTASSAEEKYIMEADIS